jgi:hypothetical protein
MYFIGAKQVRIDDCSYTVQVEVKIGKLIHVNVCRSDPKGGITITVIGLILMLATQFPMNTFSTNIRV